MCWNGTDRTYAPLAHRYLKVTPFGRARENSAGPPAILSLPLPAWLPLFFLSRGTASPSKFACCVNAFARHRWGHLASPSAKAAPLSLRHTSPYSQKKTHAARKKEGWIFCPQTGIQAGQARPRAPSQVTCLLNSHNQRAKEGTGKERGADGTFDGVRGRRKRGRKEMGNEASPGNACTHSINQSTDQSISQIEGGRTPRAITL